MWRSWRVAGAFVAAVICAAASSVDAHAGKSGSAAVYEVSFRSRDTTWFGHNYVVVRRFSGGAVVESRLVGFGPVPEASDLDALVGTAGWVGAESGDRRDPVTRDYTVRIGRKQYEQVLRTIAAYRRHTPDFELLGTNCNTFVGAVGRAAGLAIPANEAMLPETYIEALRELNTGGSVPGARAADADGTSRRAQRQARADRPFHSADVYDWDAPR